MIITKKIMFVSMLAMALSFVIIAALSGPLHIVWFTP